MNKKKRNESNFEMHLSKFIGIGLYAAIIDLHIEWIIIFSAFIGSAQWHIKKIC